MDFLELQKLRLELAVKNKKGSDFILSASLIWFAIAFIWSTPATAYQNSVYTLIIGSFMLPMAFGLSRILKTSWKVVDNPLQPLGLWLNFAQLFYFPFLVFVLLILPDYFVMTYAIITGAHLFPYAWFYDDNTYAIMAGIISASSLILGLNLDFERQYIIPLFTGFAFLATFIILWTSIPKTNQRWEDVSRQILKNNY